MKKYQIEGAIRDLQDRIEQLENQAQALHIRTMPCLFDGAVDVDKVTFSTSILLEKTRQLKGDVHTILTALS